MSEYSSLKATINANVKTNGNQEITGSIMNSVLNAMVNSLGTGYQFMGVATPTNPGTAQTPDYKCFYLATTPGTYANLGGLVVADGEVALLKYDTAWTKELTGVATADQVSQLGQEIDNTRIFNKTTSGTNFPCEIIAGHRYFIRVSGVPVYLTTRLTPDGSTVDEIGSISDFIEWTATNNANYLRGGSTTQAVTITITDESSIKFATNENGENIASLLNRGKFFRNPVGTFSLNNTGKMTDSQINEFVENVNSCFDSFESLFGEIKLAFKSIIINGVSKTVQVVITDGISEKELFFGDIENEFVAYTYFNNIPIRAKGGNKLYLWLYSITDRFEFTSTISDNITNGFSTKDITNRQLYPNGISNNYCTNFDMARGAFEFNENVKYISAITDNYIFDLSQIISDGNALTLRVRVNKANSGNVISSNDPSYRAFQATLDLRNITSGQEISFNYYGNIHFKICFIGTTFGTFNIGGAESEDVVSPFAWKSYKAASPVFYSRGYLNTNAEIQDVVGYNTYVLPINDDCSLANIRCVCDKNANIALADKSGFFKKWVFTNADGTKYSGEEEFDNAIVDVTGYSFIVISVKGDLLNIAVSILGYDYDKSIDSYNALTYSKIGQPKNIHLYQATKTESGIVTADTRDIKCAKQLDVENFQVTFTDPVTGYVYEKAILFDVDKASGTRYFYAENHGNQNHAIIWKQQGESSSVILRCGEEPPIDYSVYPEYQGCEWLIAGAAGNFGLFDFVRCLSDGELLIGMQFIKPIPNQGVTEYHKLYAVFRTSNNQSVWIPKFACSHQHYVYNNQHYNVYGYPTKNNSICIENNLLSRNMILISEYGNGTSEYWQQQGISVNGRGVSGKMWLSIDNGVTFKKIFDMDEKINGVASDISDGNWKWVDSYIGRQGIHLHCCCIDRINGMIWMTNGDCSEESQDSIFYANLNDLVVWMQTKGQATDPHNLMPTYADNEVLCENIHQWTFQKYYNGIGIPFYANFLKRVGLQFYCILPTSRFLLFGHDLSTDIVYGIHNDVINRNSLQDLKSSNPDANESTRLFIDIVADLGLRQTRIFPQCFVQRENGGMILMLKYQGIVASYNCIDWAYLCRDSTIIGFESYAVEDIDGKYIIMNMEDQSNYKMTKILNY